jgi:hypothetical protein
MGAFGGFFGWINAFDEGILARRANAYGEQMPEGHFPRIGFRHMRKWSSLGQNLCSS